MIWPTFLARNITNLYSVRFFWSNFIRVLTLSPPLHSIYAVHFSRPNFSTSCLSCLSPHHSVLRPSVSLTQVFCVLALSSQLHYIYTGWSPQNGTVDFAGLCSDQQLSFFTLLDRASFPHYNNTKIIKFGWELFILWVISYGLSFSGFARFPEFRGTINDSFGRP